VLRLGATQTDYELIALQISQRAAAKCTSLRRCAKRHSSYCSHAENVLRHQVMVDRLVGEITAPTVSRATQSLAEAYNSAFARKLREANVYRFILLLVAVGLLTYAGFAFLRLRHNTGELKRALDKQALKSRSASKHSWRCVKARSAIANCSSSRPTAC